MQEAVQDADNAGTNIKDNSKVSKNKRKKKRKKNKKKRDQLEKEENEMKDAKTASSNDIEVDYIQETLGLHELAPQYRQFYHIFEAFKIADNKPDIPPPTLAIPTSLSSKAVITALGDQFQEDMEESDEVCPFFKQNMCSMENHLVLFI